MFKTFGHKPSLMCLCAECSEYRALHNVQQVINWANGSLLDRTLRVDRTPPKGCLLPVSEARENGLLRPADPSKSFVVIGVR